MTHDCLQHPEVITHMTDLPEEQLNRRLGDSREFWLERADPATVA